MKTVLMKKKSNVLEMISTRDHILVKREYRTSFFTLVGVENRRGFIFFFFFGKRRYISMKAIKKLQAFYTFLSFDMSELKNVKTQVEL